IRRAAIRVARAVVESTIAFITVAGVAAGDGRDVTWRALLALTTATTALPLACRRSFYADGRERGVCAARNAADDLLIDGCLDLAVRARQDVQTRCGRDVFTSARWTRRTIGTRLTLVVLLASLTARR